MVEGVLGTAGKHSLPFARCALVEVKQHRPLQPDGREVITDDKVYECKCVSV